MCFLLKECEPLYILANAIPFTRNVKKRINIWPNLNIIAEKMLTLLDLEPLGFLEQQKPCG
jgi:hypothetical protein